MKKKSITAAEFDRKFDNGEDMTEFLDLDNVSKPGNHPQRITIDFPEWMVIDLDRLSKQRGIPKEDIIRILLSEKLKDIVRENNINH